jgi:hypothetical protein
MKSVKRIPEQNSGFVAHLEILLDVYGFISWGKSNVF